MSLKDQGHRDMKKYTTLEDLQILSGSHKSVQQTDGPSSTGEGTWSH